MIAIVQCSPVYASRHVLSSWYQHLAVRQYCTYLPFCFFLPFCMRKRLYLLAFWLTVFDDTLVVRKWMVRTLNASCFQCGIVSCCRGALSCCRFISWHIYSPASLCTFVSDRNWYRPTWICAVLPVLPLSTLYSMCTRYQFDSVLYLRLIGAVLLVLSLCTFVLISSRYQCYGVL